MTHINGNVRKGIAPDVSNDISESVDQFIGGTGMAEVELGAHWGGGNRRCNRGYWCGGYKTDDGVRWILGMSRCSCTTVVGQVVTVGYRLVAGRGDYGATGRGKARTTTVSSSSRGL